MRIMVLHPSFSVHLIEICGVIKLSIFFGLLFSLTAAIADIEIRPNKIDFGSVNTGQTASLEIECINTGTSTEQLTRIDWFINGFSSNFSPVRIEAGTSARFTLFFSPLQNITYNTELVLGSDRSPFNYIADMRGKGQLALSYYQSTFDLWEEDLKSELKRLISSGYTSLGYNTARDNMYGSFDNEAGWVSCVYTGRKAQFNTRSGATSNNFNTEHTWPQSLFNSNEPERSDLHHLFPTDESANSTRGNLPFGVVASATWSNGGSKMGGGLFEPRDEHKGATARAMFYFATRYTNYSNFLSSQESILRQWHNSFPPQSKDSLRNEAISRLQKNRNPYVDFPGFTERITSISSNSPRIFKSILVTSHSQLNISPDMIYRIYYVNTGNKTADFTASSDKNNPDIQFTTGPEVVLPGESSWVEIYLPENGSRLTQEIKLSDGQKIKITIKSLSNNDINPQEPTIIWQEERQVLQLKSLPTSTYRLQVYDAHGRQVVLTELSTRFNEISLQHLPAGMYFVEISGPQVTEIKRIFKLR